MKDCEYIRQLLDEVIDEYLSADRIAEIDHHLEQCRPCRDQLQALREIRKAASRLPGELDPPRDLWPGINAHLHQRPTSGRRTHRLAWAAALVLAATASLLWDGHHRPATPTHAVSQTRSYGAATAHHETTSLAEVRASYRNARTELLNVIDSRRSGLAPETLEVITKNMVLIDNAIFEIESALEAAPGEERLDRQLLMAYNQQIELLRWAARLSA
ncbi:MAG: hypothetical protein K8R59_10750 [Thermoanaerobaculales bacterium]|nr:hypothetical protein [Thermoanaerobaculales bacterium]